MPLGSLHGQCMNNMPSGVEGGCLAELFFVLFFCPCLAKENDCYAPRGRLLGSSLLHNVREVDRLKIALGAQVSLDFAVRYWRSEDEWENEMSRSKSVQALTTAVNSVGVENQSPADVKYLIALNFRVHELRPGVRFSGTVCSRPLFWCASVWLIRAKKRIAVTCTAFKYTNASTQFGAQLMSMKKKKKTSREMIW